MYLNIFSNAKCGNVSFEFCAFSFFYDLVLESNLIMEKIPSALSISLCVGLRFFISLSCSRLISLSLSLSVSLFNSSVDAALQRLLCGMMSSSITLISGPFNQAKTNRTKQWLDTDKANPSPVV